jgi:hypothetical protein
MAAGLGFKDFTTGEVLTAADVDGYLMQGIWVFASAAARDAAVTSPQEGNFAFLKDTNVTTYYTGSAWANLDTTGMTNPMTTTGDTIYSSSGSTPARLGIGTAGQVLQVNSGATAPEWATPAGGGGMTLLATHTLSGSTSTISGISGSYTDLVLICTNGVNSALAGGNIFLNGDTTSSNYYTAQINVVGSTLDGATSNNASAFQVGTTSSYNDSTYLYIHIPRYAQTENKMVMLRNLNRGSRIFFSNLLFASTAAITSVGFNVSSGSWSSGTVYVYGVK